ncbi:hypothetical protein K474DRAFT_1708216 [Panus rudis PR-1116 ss-1]|nr:hypothetical protein K474DRAFT_1708216 [Panus rudis PR-1116 ss-1]
MVFHRRRPRLPQEMIDEVILHLRDNKSALKAFSRVSRACLPVARRYLLANFTYRLDSTDHTFDAFVHKLRQGAVVAQYITDLTITGDPYYPTDSSHYTREEHLRYLRGTPAHLIFSTRILPQSVLRLLPKLASLTLDSVWLRHENAPDAPNVAPIDGPYHDISETSPSMFSVQKLTLSRVCLSWPVDHAMLELFTHVACDQLVIKEFDPPGPPTSLPHYLPFPHMQHLPPLLDFPPLPPSPSIPPPPVPLPPHPPQCAPSHLAFDWQMMETRNLEMLTSVVLSSGLKSLYLPDILEQKHSAHATIPILASFLTPARDILTNLELHISSLEDPGLDPWRGFNLLSFTTLRTVTIRVELLGLSEKNERNTWNSLIEFLRHLPTTITSLYIPLRPGITRINRKAPCTVLDRMPDRVKDAMDEVFSRFLPALKYCEIVCQGHPQTNFCKSDCITEIKTLVPSLSEVGILHLQNGHSPE